MNSLDDMIVAARTAAYAGEPDEGFRLIVLSPNSSRGLEVARAFHAQIPVATFREMLEAAWTQDHWEVFRAAGNDQMLKRWFKYAAYDVSQLASDVTLYRGGTCFYKDDTHWQTPGSLCWGHSWALDRDAACFFATVYAQRSPSSLPAGAHPCVVAIQVPRRYVLAHFTDRQESEIVAFTRSLNRHIIDGANVSAARAGISWRPSDELKTAWREAGEGYSSLIWPS
jgi:hypothetical protein